MQSTKYFQMGAKSGRNRASIDSLHGRISAASATAHLDMDTLQTAVEQTPERLPFSILTSEIDE